MRQVAKHSTDESCWIVVNGKVRLWATARWLVHRKLLNCPLSISLCEMELHTLTD